MFSCSHGLLLRVLLFRLRCITSIHPSTNHQCVDVCYATPYRRPPADANFSQNKVPPKHTSSPWFTPDDTPYPSTLLHQLSFTPPTSLFFSLAATLASTFNNCWITTTNASMKRVNRNSFSVSSLDQVAMVVVVCVREVRAFDREDNK